MFLLDLVNGKTKAKGVFAISTCTCVCVFSINKFPSKKLLSCLEKRKFKTLVLGRSIKKKMIMMMSMVTTNSRLLLPLVSSKVCLPI